MLFYFLINFYAMHLEAQSYHSQTHFFLPTSLGMLHVLQRLLKGDQAAATYFRDKHNAEV